MALSVSKDYVELEFPSLAENIRLARLVAAIFASRLDFTIDEIEDIKTATSEAVSNAVAHAYPQAPGSVRMRVAVEEGALTIRVEDEGRGIDDLEWAKQPWHSTLPEEHPGLGLIMMTEFMDEVTVDSKAGMGTRVWMVKRPAQAGRGPGAGGPVLH